MVAMQILTTHRKENSAYKQCPFSEEIQCFETSKM